MYCRRFYTFAIYLIETRFFCLWLDKFLDKKNDPKVVFLYA